MLAAYDLTAPAPNGLRRGFTTGTCATAAVKAAALRLVLGIESEEVAVPLPDGEHYLSVPVEGVGLEGASSRATVIKEAGDDPDVTHRARISAAVSVNALDHHRWFRGEGVGVVTQAGLQIPVGEPAINPVPRAMMTAALLEVCQDAGLSAESYFDIEISCEGGKEIAQRTFNPRLGIEGGISIIGTTGIVEPKSRAAFLASIELYIRVALAESPEAVVLTPGNLGQRFAVATLGLPLRRVVQMSNYVGQTMSYLRGALEEQDSRLPILWVAGHPGKLAKILDGVEDTHSSHSDSACSTLVARAVSHGFPSDTLKKIQNSTTAEGIAEILREEVGAEAYWDSVATAIAQRVASAQNRVDSVRAMLFAMSGTRLGEGEA